MKIVCPECGFLGKIKDDEIPQPGQTVGCPKCKARFPLELDTDYSRRKNHEDTAPDGGGTEPPPDANLERLDETELFHSDIPQSPGKIEWDADIGNEGSGGKKMGGKRESDIKKIALLSIAILLALGIGFTLGRATKSAPPERPAPPKTVKMEEPKKPAPAEVVEDEKSEEEEDLNATPVPVPLPSTPEPEDGTETAAPGIDWDKYTSDEYFNITEIDRRVKEWLESDLTDIQRETEAREYASTFLGKNLNGTLVIKEVRRRYFKGVDFPGMNDSFPDESYLYVVKAVSAEPVSQWEHELCDVLIGMKGTEDIAESLRKGGEIYVEGIIYSWKISGRTYDIYLVNSKVELID